MENISKQWQEFRSLKAELNESTPLTKETLEISVPKEIAKTMDITNWNIFKKLK